MQARSQTGKIQTKFQATPRTKPRDDAEKLRDRKFMWYALAIFLLLVTIDTYFIVGLLRG